MQTNQDRHSRHWPLVAAAALLLAISTGTRTSMGLFAGPLNTATALGAATIALALALGQLAWGAAQPLLGPLASRFGTARLIAWGGFGAAVAFAALTIAADTMSLLLVALVSGATSAAAGSPPLLMGFVMRRVPQHRMGLALGLVSAGGSAGQLVLALAGAALITFAGWQAALLGFAVLTLAALPLARAFRGSPAAADATTTAEPPAVHAGSALREPTYWLLTFGFFVCGFHVAFLTTHMPAVIELCGLPTTFSGLWLAIVGACNIAGSIAAGWIGQRCSMKGLLGWVYALRALGVTVFVISPPTQPVLLGFALWMGVTYMATLPPTTGLIGKLYGARNVATLFGITMLMHQVGGFLGVWLGGLELELTGGYRWVWFLDIVLALAAALVHVPIREPGPSTGGKGVATTRLGVAAAR